MHIIHISDRQTGGRKGGPEPNETAAKRAWFPNRFGAMLTAMMWIIYHSILQYRACLPGYRMARNAMS